MIGKPSVRHPLSTSRAGISNFAFGMESHVNLRGCDDIRGICMDFGDFRITIHYCSLRGEAKAAKSL